MSFLGGAFEFLEFFVEIYSASAVDEEGCCLDPVDAEEHEDPGQGYGFLGNDDGGTKNKEEGESEE